VVLRDGDELIVPKIRQEVTIIGEVQNSTSLLHRAGLKRDDYIDLSGGFTRRADKSRAYVVRADGSVVAGAARHRRRSRCTRARSARRKSAGVCSASWQHLPPGHRRTPHPGHERPSHVQPFARDSPGPSKLQRTDRRERHRRVVYDRRDRLPQRQRRQTLGIERHHDRIARLNVDVLAAA